MGIYEWITSLTGSWGPGLLSAYQSHALWINSAVVIYGLVLALSWQNVDRITGCLVRQMVEQASRMPDGEGRSPRRVSMRAFRLSWEEALSESAFPFVARQADFIPRRTTLGNLRLTISSDYLFKRSAAKLRRLGVELER